MSEFTKISYFDLKLEAGSKRLPQSVCFEKEIERLNRILSRNLQHSAIVSAPSGSGKTALLYGWANEANKSHLFGNKKIVLLDTSSLQKVGQVTQNSLGIYQDAFFGLENCVLIIDSFGEMIFQSLNALQNWNTLLKPLFFKKGISLILSMQPEELAWLEQNKSHFLSHFETLKLEVRPEENQIKILRDAVKNLYSGLKLEEGIIELILKLCHKFPSLGQLPKSSLRLLDEAAAEARARFLSILTKEAVEKIASEKTGVPVSRLNDNDKNLLKNLPNVLEAKIVGQSPAISKMVSVIQRARLGLRSQTKPLGSFLLLGPSGVGKTESAKILAQELYGSASNFLRIDMSEFAESHATSRLLGSPAGYVGFESGGQLTNHFQNFPYSLLLLDEIEKAHSKIFDIFLQILDDGRITSAAGQTVDLTQSIIMATSNLAVNEILEGFQAGHDVFDQEFIKTFVMPKLLENFRMEFLNRFDAILIYKPLSVHDLTSIALLEINKIEERVKEQNIKFNISLDILSQKVAGLYDPRFGARPIKRFIEETCENLITQQLLNN